VLRPPQRARPADHVLRNHGQYRVKEDRYTAYINT
jgi:hypothetical protein